MSDNDVNVIMSKLEIMDFDIKELKRTVNKLSESNIESRSKVLDCEDRFDQRYVCKTDFRAYFTHEWNMVSNSKFARIKDTLLIIYPLITILLILLKLL